MAVPLIEVLGVYKLPVSDELVREQYEISYAPGDEEDAKQHLADTRELLESVVLIELCIRNRDDRYDASDFTQAFADRQRGDWPAAYCEVYFSPDGESIIEIRSSEPPSGDLRVAFYLHDWDPKKLLHTSYGDVRCPAPEAMPERLRRLAPFEPYD